MAEVLHLGDMQVEVIRKDIKHVHLSVLPPEGKVRISAPLRTRLDTLRAFTVTRLGWIRQEQKKMRAQKRETPREYLNKESHYLWGKRYLLELKAIEGKAFVQQKHRKLVLSIKPDATEEEKAVVMEAWYREQLKNEMPVLIAKWEKKLGVKVQRFFVQRMKTRWGSCNAVAGNIRINTELAKKPKECLEYIVVHEMVHLKEPSHNARFVALLDKHMPGWNVHRDILNGLPVRHENWVY